MNRRQLINRAGIAAIAAWTGSSFHAAAQAVEGAGRLVDSPILDAHIHIFDPTRLGGVPWPLPDDVIYKPALPSRYEALAKPMGVRGAIAIEASPLKTDNDWLLKVVRESSFMVGMIGDLPPTLPDFNTELDRLHRDPLFLGIRHGNLWNRNLTEDLKDSKVWQNLQRLADHHLVFETANPDMALLEAVMDVAERVPRLRIVVDHLPHMQQLAGKQGSRDFARRLGDLGTAPNVSVKLSEIAELKDGRLVREVGFYREHLDMLWNTFGEDRCLFGSDWPNSDHVAPLDQTISLVEDYFSTKTSSAGAKFFLENSRRVYGWKARSNLI